MTAIKREAFLAGAAGLVAVLATACSSSGGYGAKSTPTSAPTPAPTSSSAPGSASPAKITIASFAFTGPLTVSPGATVTVMNTDAAEHTVTADSAGMFDVSVPGGQTMTFTAPSAPGTYPYHCSIHPSMHGTLIVK